MAGRKYAVVLYARTPPTYQSLSAADKAKPGKAFEQVLKQYAGKVDMVRRYWTSAFTNESSDIFILEADDPMDIHSFQEALTSAMSRGGGDPTRFGSTVHVSFGINPDADAPRATGRRGR